MTLDEGSLRRRARAARAYEAYWRVVGRADWALVAFDACYSGWRLRDEWPSPSAVTLVGLLLLPVGVAIASTDQRRLVEGWVNRLTVWWLVGRRPRRGASRGPRIG